MAPPKFGDFGKEVSDLLGNDYCFDRKFKVKTRTATGFELTSEGTLKAGANAVGGKLTTKFNIGQGITVNKLGVDHNGRLFADVGYSDVIKGLSLSTVVEEGGKAPTFGEFGITYKHPVWTGSLKTDAMNGPTMKASASAVLPMYEKLVVGGEVKYNTGFDNKTGGSLADYNAGVVLKDLDFLASLTTKKQFGQLEVNVHHQVSPRTEVGAQCLYDRKSQGVMLSVGGIYLVDPMTKLQGKVDSNGLVSVNAHQTLSKNATLIASAQVDSKSLNADSHKFGLQLSLS